MYDALPCPARAIANSVTLGKRSDVPFAEGSGRGSFSEFVNPQTGRIQLNAVSEKDLFFTQPGQEVLFAILTFPVAARAVGAIDLKFTPDSLVLDGNKLADNNERGLTAITEDGSVTPGTSAWPAGALSLFRSVCFWPHSGSFKRTTVRREKNESWTNRLLHYFHANRGISSGQRYR
jgi:hypothetical protein